MQIVSVPSVCWGARANRTAVRIIAVTASHPAHIGSIAPPLREARSCTCRAAPLSTAYDTLPSSSSPLSMYEARAYSVEVMDWDTYFRVLSEEAGDDDDTRAPISAILEVFGAEVGTCFSGLAAVVIIITPLEGDHVRSKPGVPINTNTSYSICIDRSYNHSLCVCLGVYEAAGPGLFADDG
jgi:hypothetical protein